MSQLLPVYRWRGRILLAGVAIGAAVVIWNWNSIQPMVAELMGSAKTQVHTDGKFPPLVELVPGSKSTLQLTTRDASTILRLKTAEVKLAPSPTPLRLPGSLFLDPNHVVHVHSRFSGEVVDIGETVDGDKKRPLQYGDRVTKGQLLAVVWSKEVGEKKSELVDSLSRLDMSRSLLKRLTALEKGVVSERTVVEARRTAEADMIAVARAERTLRSWRMSDEEIEVARREYRNLQTQDAEERDAAIDRKWAETEVRAAIDGVLIEKNFNVGDIVDPSDELLKIADLRRMQILANVYEEDLWALRRLKPEERRWSIDLKSDPADNALKGTFELIGSVIDPAQRTGVVMGWLDNSDFKLLVGQFITATVQLPVDPDIVAIPETALIEEGDSSTVFVETNADQRQYTRRKVHVVRRFAGTVYIDSTPESDEAEPLRVGDRVVINGSLALGGELANLRANAPNH